IPAFMPQHIMSSTYNLSTMQPMAPSYPYTNIFAWFIISISKRVHEFCDCNDALTCLFPFSEVKP
ncbi:hypothetical protein RSAG8_11699, partial [Rhizoctonia solani AG-8 WAC10335]